MNVPPRLASLLLCAAWAATPAAGAGECRAQLRPLLLRDAPAAADLARVNALCQAEADAGDADATYQLALFSLGLAGNWQPETALPLVRSAADRGVSEAQYWMAWQSESGPLLPNDPAVALGWYEKAAAGRHKLALIRLAEASERGELGLPVDEQRALGYRAQVRKCEEEERAKGGN